MTTAIVGATLIDGTGADPVEGSTVVIEDDRITRVGASTVPIPRDAAVLDAEGCFLLPGLIDTHVHLTLDGNFDPAVRVMTPPSLRLLRAVPNARATLDAGITTVRDAGWTPPGVKLAIEQGFFPGPRMQLAIGILSQTGGHGDPHLPCGLGLAATLLDIPAAVVDGPTEVQRAARELLRDGADWIKVCATGGVLSRGDHPAATQFTGEELAAAVNEARAQGKRVMAHAMGTEGIKNAIRAGVRSIEHGVWLDEEAVELMVEEEAWLVPTLLAPVAILERAEAAPGSMPEWAVTKTRECIAAHRASFRRAAAAGVRIAMGTDCGVGAHGENARELRLMVEGGMTPMQAIVSATGNAAQLLYPSSAPVGSVAPGKLADLVVVTSNPLDDVSVLERPAEMVLITKNGVAHKSTLPSRTIFDNRRGDA